jgi:hypothetical protein
MHAKKGVEMAKQPMKVVKLNKKEIKLWNCGYFFKCAHKLRVTYNIGETVEIRDSENDKRGYANITAIYKIQSKFASLGHNPLIESFFSANLPPEPLITVIAFEMPEESVLIPVEE